ncbi:hypothetical protein C0991_012211 [Blastosporella zonata]|nr:hypothetical protein C0991_012211 [Blastosporella zonata]
MLSGTRFLSLYALSAIAAAYGQTVISSSGSLQIANAQIAPDGFTRSYHQPAPALVASGQITLSAATLINGAGRYVGGPKVPLAVVGVEKGKRYRFRLIGMSCDPAFTFSIDGHQLTIIEADGENTAPLLVDALEIYAGQRYSVVLNANKPVDSYWIRANPNNGNQGFVGGINSAILQYIGAPEMDPTTVSKVVNHLNEVNLHALDSPAAPGLPRVGGADVSINLVTTVNFQTSHYEMNGVPFVPPTAPVLLQILSGAQSAQDLLPKGSVYELPLNKVIEISLPGTSAALGGPVSYIPDSHSIYRS